MSPGVLSGVKIVFKNCVGGWSLPRTPLRELTAIPDLLAGLRGGERKGKGEKGARERGRREEKGWKGDKVEVKK